MARIESITDVAERHMCTGCGTCAFVQPDAIVMVDDLDQGRRPMVSSGTDTDVALEACPGIRLEHDYDRTQPDLIGELAADWGPVLEMWDGFAADEELRWRASSGGAATALALFAVEQQGFHGVLHIAARKDVPWLNETVLSRDRAALLAATGSRYAPASPCDSLEAIASAPAPCVLIGKPCDIAGAQMARRLRPQLDERLGLTIAIFCAGTPSTAGTLEMLRRMGVDPAQLDAVRYRGEGWPGMAQATGRDSDGQSRHAELTYQQSWGDILNKHRPWRCYVCADHTGEFADIAVGDPWYHGVGDGGAGRSLIVARTARGRRFVQLAIAAGALTCESAAADALPRAQPNLRSTRGSVWGRSLATRMFGIAAPRLTGLPTRSAWLQYLTLKQQLQSFYGTWKRVFTKRLYKRRPVVPYVAVAAKTSERSSSAEPTAGDSAP